MEQKKSASDQKGETVHNSRGNIAVNCKKSKQYKSTSYNNYGAGQLLVPGKYIAGNWQYQNRYKTNDFIYIGLYYFRNAFSGKEEKYKKTCYQSEALCGNFVRSYVVFGSFMVAHNIRFMLIVFFLITHNFTKQRCINSF